MNYRYKVRDRYGKAITGFMSGENKDVVAKHLSSIGYIPISIEEAKETGREFLRLKDIFKFVSLEELNVFTRQLHTLQRAGIPLLGSLGVLEKQTKNRYFKDVIKEVIARVEEGVSLSDAMAKYPEIFGDFYVNMIKAGEASGELDEVLARLSEFGDKELDNRSKVKAATRYPLITLCALFAAFGIVVTFVIPRFSKIFSQFNTALPLPTRILLGISQLVKNWWYLIIIAVIIFIAAFLKYINTKNGRLVWDMVKLRVPVFGSITSMLVMSRFTRTMSILTKSGLPILQVLDMVSRTVGNSVVSRTIDSIASSVREGKGISEPMRVSGIFPPMVVQMVAVGEETGKVDELLMRVSEYYDQQSDYMIKNLTTMIEPVFILVLGAMVLVMALGVFLPMWNLVTLFRR